MNIALLTKDNLRFGAFNPPTVPASISGDGIGVIDTCNDGNTSFSVASSSLTNTLQYIFDGTATTIASAYNVASVQIDSPNGRVYWLESEVDKIGPDEFDVPCYIYSCRLDGTDRVRFDPVQFSSDLLFCTDMKLSKTSNTIWVSSSTTNRVYGFDRHTGNISQECFNDNMSFPTTIAVDHATGALFIRCHNMLSELEAICRFSGAGIDYMFDIPGSTTLQEAIASFSSGESSFLGSNSMKYDHIRKRLAWVALSGELFVLNEPTMSVNKVS